MRNNEYSTKRGRMISDPGSPIHVVLSPELQKDGTLKLVPTGKENTDEIIASYYESTTLECILARFANGDMSALNRYQPIYMDITQMPKTLAEAQQKVINAEYAFQALPANVKEQFGNNFNVWLAQAGTEEWMSKMADIFTLNNEKNSEASRPAEGGSDGGEHKEA